jgi:hypothetical protein
MDADRGRDLIERRRRIIGPDEDVHLARTDVMAVDRALVLDRLDEQILDLDDGVLGLSRVAWPLQHELVPGDNREASPLPHRLPTKPSEAPQAGTVRSGGSRGAGRPAKTTVRESFGSETVMATGGDRVDGPAGVGGSRSRCGREDVPLMCSGVMTPLTVQRSAGTDGGRLRAACSRETRLRCAPGAGVDRAVSGWAADGCRLDLVI